MKMFNVFRESYIDSGNAPHRKIWSIYYTMVYVVKIAGYATLSLFALYGFLAFIHDMGWANGIP